MSRFAEDPKLEKLKLAAKNLEKDDSFYAKLARHLIEHNKEAFSDMMPSQIMHMFLAGAKNPDIFRQFAQFCDQNSHAAQSVTGPDFEDVVETLYIFKINQSEQLKLDEVSRNGLSIRYVHDPSESVKLAAVNQNPWAIEYVRNSSEEVQLAAVSRNGHTIKSIEDPSEAVQLAAVRQNAFVLAHIDDPSEAVQLAAVEQNEYAIKFVLNPSIRVQIAAVSKNPKAIEVMENPCKEAKDMVAVSKIHAE